METVQIGSLTCKPLHPTFAAEIDGVDFSKPIPENVVRDMIAAQDRFGVTVYRNTGLDDDGHVALSAQLGDLELCPRFAGPNVPTRFDNPYLFDAGNTDREGNIIQRDTRRWWYNKGNALWHTDSSFNQFRSKYSLLLAHTVPGEGGNTEFADVRTAYNDLPDQTKRELKDLVLEHSLWHSRKLAAPQAYQQPTPHEIAVKPPAFHKLVQTAPDGRDTLFLAAHARTVIGVPDDEGLKLITKLIEHCTKPQYTVSVKWNGPGDLVWWDNRCTMHRATPFPDQMVKRDMRRTTVFDDSSTKDGVGVEEVQVILNKGLKHIAIQIPATA